MVNRLIAPQQGLDAPSRSERALLAEGAMLRNVLVHLAIWTATILVVAVVTRLAPGRTAAHRAFLTGVFEFVGTLALPVYAARWIADHVRPGAWWKAAGIIAVCAAWAVAFEPVQKRFGTGAPLISLFAAMLLAVGLTLGVRGMRRAWQIDRRVPVAERLQRAAEQRLFGARLAPQVLREGLETLHEVALRSPELATPLILDLSAMMRHLVSASSREQVSLREEREYLEAARRLFIARDGQHGEIQLQFEGEDDELVPALLPATLFHNALRQGLRDARGANVRVAMSATQEGIRLWVAHQWPVASTPSATRSSAQLGLSLLRRRLQHALPGRHRLEARESSQEFGVELTTW